MVCSPWGSSVSLSEEKSFGDIDLFSRVNKTVPCNQFGNVCPVSGRACMGLNIGYPREIATASLKRPLENNKTYCISFYISTSFRTDTKVKFRVLFADTVIKNFSSFYFFPKTVALTECETGMDNWKKVHAVYKAGGRERYLSIGNFDDEYDPAAPVKNPVQKHKWHDSYYFVDDVLVKELIAGEKCDCEVTNEFYPLEKEKCGCGPTAKKIENKSSPVNVFFETAKYSMNKSAFVKLDSLIAVLTVDKTLKAIITGFADVDGTEAGNKDLSFNRAKSVADYLIKKGIAIPSPF